jgi:rhodanese-related sulfurtransferase
MTALQGWSCCTVFVSPVSGSLFSGGFFVTFFTHYTNLALIAVFIVSGAMLLWPMRGRARGLSAAEATQLINRRNAAVIDMRDAAAFAQGHLPAARRVDARELPTKIGQLVKNKKTPVLLVCQSGQRAAMALKSVRDAGFAEVCVLGGGMNAWQRANLPVVKNGNANSNGNGNGKTRGAQK